MLTQPLPRKFRKNLSDCDPQTRLSVLQTSKLLPPNSTDWNLSKGWIHHHHRRPIIWMWSLLPPPGMPILWTTQ
jgi:hypothetical protein